MMQLCRCLLAFSAIAASGVTVRVTIERPLVRFFGLGGFGPASAEITHGRRSPQRRLDSSGSDSY